MKRKVGIPERIPYAPELGVLEALTAKMLRELNLHELIESSIECDPAHWKTCPGDLAEGIILATMGEMRPPLCRISERLAKLDYAILYNNELSAEDFNQYNLGEMLERLGRANPQKMYQTFALNAYTVYNIRFQRLHADTSTVSFSGVYEGESGMLQPERGYNKDGRPQDLQVVVGQITDENGIVLDQEVMNGSTSDVSWNTLAIEHAREIQKHLPNSPVPLIADSKLVCDAHMKTLLGNNLQFITRLPSNFGKKLEARKIREAVAKGSWEELGKVGQGKKASCYQGQSFVERMEGKKVRVLVLKSSTLKLKAEERMAKDEEELQLLAKKLEGQTFFCEADAEKELSQFRKSRHLQRYRDDFRLYSEQIEHWPRGPHKKGASPTSVETHYHWEFLGLSKQEDIWKRDLEEASCIVLLAHVPESYTDKEILEAYKGQQVVENSFRLLKEPALADALYLKNQDRIAGMMLLLHLSLLIRALIQYRMRQGHEAWKKEHPGEELRIGYDNKKTDALTFAMFFVHSRDLHFVRDHSGGFQLNYLNRSYLEKTLKYLEFMGMEPGDVLDMPC